MFPPNFVTLRHLKELKEKRDEEERLKREEEDRVRKLREEEESRKPRPETLGSSESRHGRSRNRGSRPSANVEQQVAEGGGSMKSGKQKRWRKSKKGAVKERNGEMTEMPLGVEGSGAMMRVEDEKLKKVYVNVNCPERARVLEEVVDIEKGVSELRIMGRGSPRGRGMGSWHGGRTLPYSGHGRGRGRGRGDVGGVGGKMIWVKKTVEA